MGYVRPILSKRDLADGAVAMPERLTFDMPVVGKYKETIVFVKFGAKTGSYDTLTPTPHNLGLTPKTWTIVDKGIHAVAGTAPGHIYTDDPKPFSPTHVAFRCTVPFTWAKIALR